MLKLPKKLLRFILLAGLAIGGLYFLRPDLFTSPQLTHYLQSLPASSQVLISKIPIDSSQVLGITHKISSLSIKPDQLLPDQGLPEEIVVEDLTQVLTSQLTQIPAKQAQLVKAQFCQDLIDNAVATVSGQE